MNVSLQTLKVHILGQKWRQISKIQTQKYCYTKHYYFCSQTPYPTKTRMKKCPVDISIVRPSESAEQNTLDFSFNSNYYNVQWTFR